MAACVLELQPHPLGPAGPPGLRLWGELELLNSEELQTSAPNLAAPATPGQAADQADRAGGTGSAGSGTPRPSGPAALRLTLALHAPPTDPAAEPPLLLPDSGSATAGQRLDGLWQHTCLECFLAAAGQEAYWEFNLAPGGDWNVYALDGYRQDLRPEPSLERLPFDCRWQSSPSDGLRLQLQLQTPLPPHLAGHLAEQLDSSRKGDGGAALEWNVTAVLEQRDGTLSYWAVAHRPEPADFHWRPVWRQLALG